MFKKKFLNKLSFLMQNKVLFQYLKTFLFISLILVSSKFIFQESLSIYVTNNKISSIQIFFSNNGSYVEENSLRSPILEDKDFKAIFKLPFLRNGYIRIDPANEATEIVIEKIEFKYLFGSKTLDANELLVDIKPLQMIDKLEVVPTGLLIKSSGNDPAFELYTQYPSLLYSFAQIFFLSAIISILVLACKKFLLQIRIWGNISKNIKLFNERYSLYLIPLCFSMAITAVFYPGFMTYDTLHALRGARNGVTDSMWPPMVSYVWRVVDLMSPNPAAMLFFQVSILIFSLYYVAFNYAKKTSYATLFVISYLSVPVVLGTVAVIWKDILMAAFFLAGFAVTIHIRDLKSDSSLLYKSVLAIILIFLGVCSRHNAITGAVPLLFYLSWVLCARLINNTWLKWVGIILIGSFLTGIVFIAKIQLDRYSLPRLEKLASSDDAFMQPVRILDVAGASKCVGKNLFGAMAPDLSVEEINNLYDPRHVNLSNGLFSKVGVDGRINDIWLMVAINHPICFFYNKFQLGKFMLGGNQGAQFLITAPSINENEYGYELAKSPMRDSFVNYIIHSSEWVFFKPWFLYSLSLIALIFMVWSKAIAVDSLAIFLSGGFYLLGLLLFGNAADARLPFYTTTTLFLFTYIAILGVRKKLKLINYPR